ncbi:unnamed protein product [Peronospora belbahrii]|uniref:Peptidyl-prolyl cis-trans isomerase n=1 Tax=Peronospora belbahrii TaxID=622444 RepID=A0AAU9LDH9_9STRA|nr:unnamed protein product [Peronospora belbahrii]CAH0520982.1 unnamed protein product [Peronospora belbahrii]
MAPRSSIALDTRKTILLCLGLVFVMYFIAVNTLFTFPTKSPLLTQHKTQNHVNHDHDESSKFRNQMEHEEDKNNSAISVATPPSWGVPNPEPENFRVLTTGEKGPDYTFKGSVCHRILKNFIVQCGDYTEGTGRGGRSIYNDQSFDDEPNGLRLKHSKRYILQMANRGPNTNGSQFCFMLKASPHLNGKHVVFGEVVEGFEVVDKMEEAGVERDGIPLQHKVSFTDGGEILF